MRSGPAADNKPLLACRGGRQHNLAILSGQPAIGLISDNRTEQGARPWSARRQATCPAHPHPHPPLSCPAHLSALLHLPHLPLQGAPLLLQAPHQRVTTTAAGRAAPAAAAPTAVQQGVHQLQPAAAKSIR